MNLFFSTVCTFFWNIYPCISCTCPLCYVITVGISRPVNSCSFETLSAMSSRGLRTIYKENVFK